jgi:hypothetical protein
MRLREEDGQAVPLAAALVAMAVVLVLALGQLAGDVVDAAHARSAADAAALAGVAGGRPASSAMCGRNRATLVAWRQEGADVVVTVRVGHATATARATGGDR